MGVDRFFPRALEDSGFSPFIATLRTALRNAGGLRIDHAMGLSRLWLVPEGADPANGAYLAYPLPDLLRLLALESARHNAIVVGEDLGTVPAGFRETLAQDGVHGMRVLWFERADGNKFAPSDDWDAGALAMTTTHDLPTVAGWWHGADITARSDCGRLGAGVSAADASAERERDRAALWQRFVEEGLVDGPAPPPEETRRVVDAALAFVGRTKSPLCLLPAEDLLGQEEQPNLPGTVNEHPNWRRRLPGPAEALVQGEATAARIAAIAAERPRT